MSDLRRVGHPGTFSCVFSSLGNCATCRGPFGPPSSDAFILVMAIFHLNSLCTSNLFIEQTHFLPDLKWRSTHVLNFTINFSCRDMLMNRAR